MAADEPQLISATTVWSLFCTVALLLSAYGLSRAALPRAVSQRERGMYIWHVFNALTHLILEGSFIYYSFAASSPTPSAAVPTLWGSPAISYGAKFSDAPLAKLWQEYAKADIRWGVSDVSTVCVELITVLAGGPLAVWITEMIRKGEGRRWFWMSVLATGEIYGCWMTFGPEWVSGCHNLMTGNWMYKWLYLIFFNGLWVVIPGWLLWEAYWEMVPAVEMMQAIDVTEDEKKVN